MVAEPENIKVELRGAPRWLLESVMAYKGPKVNREFIIGGPGGCIAGETELWDPIAKVGRRIDDLAKNRERPWVLTVNGPVQAEIPFIKGQEPLYRVTLESGRSCTATAAHRFLARDSQGSSRWVCLSDLAPGMELLSSCPEGAPRCWGKAQSCQDGCCPSYRRDGVRPPSGQEACLASSPSLVDALERIRVGCNADAPGSGQGCTPACPPFDRPSTPGCGRREDQPGAAEVHWTQGTSERGVCYTSDALKASSGSYLEREDQGQVAVLSRKRSEPCASCECHSEEGRASRAGSCAQAPRQQPEATEGARTPLESAELGPASGVLFLACEHSRSGWDRIKSIAYERTDFFYDLYVPGEEHYLADGIWSHNTGKSRGILQAIAFFCETIPGLRVLLCRKTRESMTSSTLVEWEECFPADHPVLEGARREQRSIYHFENGSEVAVIGLDKPTKVFSTKWSIIYFEELTEEGVESDNWDKFYRGLRHAVTVNNQRLLIGTCNPVFPEHWVRQRMVEGKCETRPTVHQDNPRWHDGTLNADGTYSETGWTEDGKAYTDGLRKMEGYTRRRLLDGEWCSADGMVFPEYNKDTHVVDGRVEENVLHIPGKAPIPVEWYFVSMDFGFRAPGCLQVWAVDDASNLYRVVEVYQRNHMIDWWADVLVQLAREFPFNRGVADCADTGSINFLNDRIGKFRGRPASRIIQPCDKSAGKLHGLDQLRWGFSKVDGGPRTFLFKDALRYGRDMDLRAKGKATCMEEELTSYVWKKVKNGSAETEEPDPNSADHAIDAAVYAHVFAWKKDLRVRKAKPRYKRGTYGATFLDDNGKPFDWPRYQ